ncbi:MAG: MerR family transcriptional regulator [Candidatus Binatia bacterium]
MAAPDTSKNTHTVGMNARLKMKDLEQATGVGREAIRFYIRAGLLPEPQRLGRNVALYDVAFVDRIRLIKELQQKRFLPLRVIKAIVDGDQALAPAEVQTLLDVDRHLLRVAGIDRDRPPVKLTDVAHRTGVPQAEIRKLAAVGAIQIISRQGERWLDDASVRIVELLEKLRAAGLTEAFGFGAENLRLYVDMVRWLAREELRVFTGGVTGKTSAQQVTAMAEAAIEILNQVIGVLRTSVLLRSIAQGEVPPVSHKPAPRNARPMHSGRHA